MKISAEKIVQPYSNVFNTKRVDNKSTGVGKMGRNFDEVMIQSSSRQIEEKKFTEDISKEVMIQVGAEASQEKISALKKQVEEGSYTIDPGAIAARMLLQQEEA